MKRVGDEIVDGMEKVGQFAVDIDGEPVPLLALSPGALAKIQDECGWRWLQIVLDPLGRPDVAGMLVEACAAKVGKPVPPFADVASLTRLFVEIPGDVPELPGEHGEANPTTASSTAG